MSVAYICPHCHRAGTAPDQLAGRNATCPGCRNAFAVPPAAPLQPPPFNGSPVQLEDDDTGPTFAQVSAVLRLILWLMCLGWVALCFALFVSAWGGANNVMQQMAAGVHWCMWLMAGFFGVYALDRLLLGRR